MRQDGTPRRIPRLVPGSHRAESGFRSGDAAVRSMRSSLRACGGPCRGPCAYPVHHRCNRVADASRFHAFRFLVHRSLGGLRCETEDADGQCGMPGGWEKRSAELRAERDAILRRAEERHVESLVRELAELLDRVWREEDAEGPPWRIRDVELRGEHPNTVIAIRRSDRSGDLEESRSYPIWQGSWERPDGGRYAPERLAADILAWALGA
jgi:hypothetical protein